MSLGEKVYMSGLFVMAGEGDGTLGAADVYSDKAVFFPCPMIDLYQRTDKKIENRHKQSRGESPGFSV